MAADAEQKPGGEGAGAGTQDKADAGQAGAGGQDKAGEKPDFQKAIDAVVARERSAAEAREKALQAQLDELRGKLPKPKAEEGDEAFRAKMEEARKPLEEQLQKERSEREAINGRVVRTELKAIATPEAVDPDDRAPPTAPPPSSRRR